MLSYNNWASLHNTEPDNNRSIRLITDSGRPQLHSAHANVVPVLRTNTRLGDWSFSVAGRRIWNSLPASLRQPDIIFGHFKRLLKAFLFGRDRGALATLWFQCAMHKLIYLLTYLLYWALSPRLMMVTLMLRPLLGSYSSGNCLYGRSILTLRSWLTVCTRTNRTLARSVMLTYVEDLHSLTQVTAAPSVNARPWPWCCDRTLFSSSMNCFCKVWIGTKHTWITTIYGFPY